MVLEFRHAGVVFRSLESVSNLRREVKLSVRVLDADTTVSIRHFE